MSNKKEAPFHNLEEIAARKQQLRRKISTQERRLSKDFDAYQEDVDTAKRLWHGIVGIRKVRPRNMLEGISRVSNKSSRLTTAFTIGAKVVKWLWDRKKRK
ncbi:MAG: hypothetical protein J5799_00745 [Bacteroidales bacterium]|nr:hypothetical protein [Bacteroidales bacterium]